MFPNKTFVGFVLLSCLFNNRRMENKDWLAVVIFLSLDVPFSTVANLSCQTRLAEPTLEKQKG